MANKLRRLLEKENNELSISVNFKTPMDRKDFLDAMDQVGCTGKAKRVPVPSSIEMRKKKGEYQYPVDKVENFIDFWVYPDDRVAKTDIIVDGKKDQVVFFRDNIGDKVRLKSVNPNILEISMMVNPKERKVEFSYTTHPEKANSVEELVLEYKKFVALLEVMFDSSERDGRTNDIIDHFRMVINKCVWMKELGETLGVCVTPQMIVEEDNPNSLLEKFYLLLVRKKIIRQNGRLDYVTVEHAESLEVGQELFAAYYKIGDIEAFGTCKTIYTVNCIFGAIVKCVEEKDDGTKVVYFEDSEKEPMFRSCSAFLNMSDAEEEMSRIDRKKGLYYDARDCMDQVKELLQEVR